MANVDVRSEIRDAIDKLEKTKREEERELDQHVRDYRFRYLMLAALRLDPNIEIALESDAKLNELRSSVLRAKAKIGELEGKIGRLNGLLTECNRDNEFRQQLAEQLDI